MVIVTVELVSARTGAREHLGTAYIVNDGTGTGELGHYDVILSKRGKPSSPWREGRVEDFPRQRLGPWDRRVFRQARVVCYVEREAYAAAVLAARMAEGALDAAPVWSDVRTFDGRPWRGAVDFVCGGFPCQDISPAGKRAGIHGERSGLWFEYVRIVEEVQPRYVFAENVAALRSRGLDVVLANLAALGFDAEWGCLRASDVGAPHRRDRIFVLAHAVSKPLRNESGWRSGACGEGAPELGHAGEQVGNPHGAGLEGRRESVGESPDERTPWPPGPEEHDRWREYLHGNGVHPTQAATALRVLWARLHGAHHD